MQLSLPLNTLPARDPVAEAEPESIEIQELLMAAGEPRAACSDKVIQSAGRRFTFVASQFLTVLVGHASAGPRLAAAGPSATGWTGPRNRSSPRCSRSHG